MFFISSDIKDNKALFLQNCRNQNPVQDDRFKNFSEGDLFILVSFILRQCNVMYISYVHMLVLV